MINFSHYIDSANCSRVWRWYITTHTLQFACRHFTKSSQCLLCTNIL